MSPFRSNKVHPRRCTCRGCKRRKKQAEKEERNIKISAFTVILTIILLGALL